MGSFVISCQCSKNHMIWPALNEHCLESNICTSLIAWLHLGSWYTFVVEGLVCIRPALIPLLQPCPWSAAFGQKIISYLLIWVELAIALSSLVSMFQFISFYFKHTNGHAACMGPLQYHLQFQTCMNLLCFCVCVTSGKFKFLYPQAF